MHFAGQPVAVVLAETPETARAAAAMVEVRYAPTPAITALDQAREAAFAPRTAGLTATDSRRGEPEAALAAAAVSARAALHHADAQPPRHRAAGGAGRVGRQRPHRAHAVAGGVRPPHHAGEVFWPRRRARAGDLFLSRRRLRLERRRLVPLPGAGLPGGKAARPPGAAGADARADVHPGRPPAGDGAAAADRRRARRPPRRPRARHRGADLDLRRVRRSGRDAHAHDVRLPQRRHHAPPGARERAAAQPGAGAGRRAGQLRAGIGAGRAGLRARPRPDRAAPAQLRRPRPACRPALVEQRTARVLPRRRRGVRLGAPAAHARHAQRRPAPSRLGHGGGLLSGLSHRLAGGGGDRAPTAA